MVKRGIMTDVERDKQRNRLYEHASEIRGEFIDKALWMESMLEDIIACEFFPNETDMPRRIVLVFFVLNVQNLTFATKINILESLLKNFHSGVIKKHPDLFTKLNRIRGLRNLFSHSSLDDTKEFLDKKYEDRIQFFIFKNGERKTRVITGKDATMYANDCLDIITELIKVREEVIQDNLRTPS